MEPHALIKWKCSVNKEKRREGRRQKKGGRKKKKKKNHRRKSVGKKRDNGPGLFRITPNAPLKDRKGQEADSILSHGSPGVPRLWLNNAAKWWELFRAGSVWGSTVPGGVAHHKTLRVGVLGVGVVIGLAGRALELLEVLLIVELLHLKQSGKN